MNIHIPYASAKPNGKANGNGLHLVGSRVAEVDELPLRAAPHNLDAEQALLGAIIVDNEAHGRVSSFLEPHHFYDPLHEQIYEAAAKLIGCGKVVTPITLRTFFETAPPIEPGLTVPQYLGRLAANATTTMNAKEYALTIVDLALRRRGILKAEDLASDLYDLTTPLDVSLRTSEADLSIIRGEASADSAAPVLFRRMADIEAVPIEWLWQGRIALRKISIMAGDPGLGKSQISCVFSAAVTTGGKWPDGTRAPMGSVIFICCEDDAADTIKPRLEAAGADSSKVFLYDWTSNRDGSRQHFDVGQHIEELSGLVRQLGDVRLIVIDPISAYMGGADSHVVADVRQALAPLQAMASDLGPAVLMVSHLNKGNGSNGAMNRVSGSGAFVAVSRSAWLVVKDPDDKKRRILTPLKNNLGDDQTGFSYRVEGLQSGEIVTSRVVFDAEPVTVSAEDLLQRVASRGEDGSALAEACEFLREELEAGPKPSKQVDASARDAGVTPASLKRARKELGVKSRKDGTGRWHIELPNWRSQGGQGDQGGQEFHG